MFIKGIMKYPVLIAGVLMFSLFLSQETTHIWWKKVWHQISTRYIPSTCNALVDRTELKAPKDWSFDCSGTQLLIITTPFDKDGKAKFTSHRELRVMMYKEVANNLSRLAKSSNLETLEFLKHIKLILKHKNLEITATTDGQAVAKFAKLKAKQDILDHLRLTVKVSEKTP